MTYKPRYWLTPPDFYRALDKEFHFDFDPCPCPRPPSYNSLEVPWGQSNYVNPHGGQVRWLEVDTGEPCKRNAPQVVAVLRPMTAPQEELR